MALYSALYFLVPNEHDSNMLDSDLKVGFNFFMLTHYKTLDRKDCVKYLILVRHVVISRRLGNTYTYTLQYFRDSRLLPGGISISIAIRSNIIAAGCSNGSMMFNLDVMLSYVVSHPKLIDL